MPAFSERLWKNVRYPKDMAHSRHNGVAVEVALLNEAIATRLDPVLRREGMTMGAFELLSAVQAARGQANQASLAKRVGVSPPSLCESIRSAVKKGFLIQLQDLNDKRSNRLSLSRKGSMAMSRILKALESIEATIEEDLGPETAAWVAESLHRVSLKLAERSGL